jgi:hypothetical protein
MITANMTEEEIIAEAKKRHNAEPFYTTLEGEIDLVRKISAEETQCLNNSLCFIDEYYQMFVNGIDGIKWTQAETQNFYNRVVRGSIRNYCNKKQFALPRDEYFRDENKKIGLEGRSREMAAMAAFVKYAAETGFQIKRENPFAGIPWESDMINDLQSSKE